MPCARIAYPGQYAHHSAKVSRASMQEWKTNDWFYMSRIQKGQQSTAVLTADLQSLQSLQSLDTKLVEKNECKTQRT